MKMSPSLWLRNAKGDKCVWSYEHDRCLIMQSRMLTREEAKQMNAELKAWAKKWGVR